jgi:hypothetical protein
MHAMLLAASTVLLQIFMVLAAFDGIYVHLVRLRLHARERSWVEHLFHTASAVLFAPILVTVFLAPTAGLTLWVGVALIALLYAVEALDVQAEQTSRTDLGGVSRGELWVHVAAFTSRTVATILVLASRPLAAWALDAPPVIGAHPAWITTVVGGAIPGAVMIAAVHVVLAWRHRPVMPVTQTA